ncbi:hypothetical protein [Streptomyces sp. NPDC059063]|uniref:hypothetical protein n=1 Tax=unclassified Streptomyces TaxID=2593676 RepID=UPI0036BBAA12
MDVEPYGARRPDGQPVAWSALDDHLLYTCHLVSDLVEGRLGGRPPIPTTARLEPGELSLAAGPAAQFAWRALGDGTYTHNSVFAFGGPAFVAGSLAASALGNAARRRRAAADAQPRWVHERPGEVTVTDRRVCFDGVGGPLDLYWRGLDSMDLVAPDTLQCAFQDIYGGGFRTVRLQTPWASLMFALAGHTTFPAHPRLLSGAWLPPDFEARCAATGRPCPPVR